MSTALMSTYARLPASFERGEGVWLYDESGEAYLDALSGIAVCGLGHAHPAVSRAVAEQAGRLVHTSNLYRIPVQERLGEALVRLSGMERVFFCNSGAEANEAAIKIARGHGHRQGIEVPAIVVFDGAFHGRTLATLSATGNPKVHAGFTPLVHGFVRVPYGDAGAVEAAVADRSDVIAVLVEPVLGEGGVVVPPAEFLPALRALCDRRGWLLMLDEIQTGMGRTGRWFAHQWHELRPDVMTLAKSLGNGVPIGACLAAGPAADVLGPGSHGSTFGGNPLACAAGLAVVGTIEDGDIVRHAETIGRRVREGLAAALDGCNCVREIRGRGLMIGIELDRPCGELVKLALERRLLINVTAERVIRLLPPLVMNEGEADRLVDTLSQLVRDWNAGDAGPG